MQGDTGQNGGERGQPERVVIRERDVILAISGYG